MNPDTVTSMLEPADADVLCGKTSTNKHPGNVFFRELVLSKVESYMRSVKKAQKGMIVAYIMKELKKNGARFLKLDKETSTWHVISAADAREKVSHAIRDRVRERKKVKIVERDSAALATPPTLSTKKGKKKVSKKRKIAKRKPPMGPTSPSTAPHAHALPVPLVTPPALHKKIKAIQGAAHQITLNTAAIGEHNHTSVVSEDDEESSSSDEMTYYAPVLTQSSNHNRTRIPDSIESSSSTCGDTSRSVTKPTFRHSITANVLDHQEYYPPLVEDCRMGPIVPYMDPCDLLLRDNSDDTPFNDLWSDTDMQSHDEDENSVYLDDYNDLVLHDFPHGHDGDSDFVVSMLQEACALMLDA